MGKQISVTKFRGLVTNPNALVTADGAMEDATNITISQEDLISTRRGFRSISAMESGFISFGIYQFAGKIFEGHMAVGTSSTTIDVAAVSTTDFSTGTIALDTFKVTLSQPASYSWRPFVTIESMTANDSWKSSCKYTLRRMTAGAEVNWSTFRATAALTSVSANIIWPYDHDAIGKFNTTIGGSFGMVPYGNRAHVLFNTVDPNKSYIIVHDPYINSSLSNMSSTSGVPEALDCDAIPGPNALSDRWEGPIRPNCQVSYRVVFLKRYSDGTEVIGAPSPICTVINPRRPCTTVSDAAPDWRFNAPSNDLKGNTYSGNERVYLYSVQGTGGTPPSDGTPYTITAGTTTSYFQIVKTAFGALTPTSCSWSTSATGYVNCSYPKYLSDVDVMYARLYRTVCSIDDTAAPTPRFYLVEEKKLSQTNTDFVSFVDSMPDDVLQFQEELYTNEDTQDGEDQASYKFPEGVDAIASYKNCVFLANPKAKDYYVCTLIKDPSYANPLNFIISYDSYSGAIDGNGSAGNAQHIWYISNITVGLNVTFTVTGQPYPLGALSNTIVPGDKVEIYANNAGMPEGLYTVTGSTGTTITIGGVVGFPVLGRRLSIAKRVTGKFTQYSADTSAVAGDYWRYGLSFAIQKTSEMIVKGINREYSVITTAKATGNLTSNVGTITVATRDYFEQGESESLAPLYDANNNFYPNSSIEINPGRSAVLAVSRQGEPESFPLLNRINVGSQAEVIIGMSTTRDSLIVIKSDGVFRVNGDSPQNFVSAAIDTTVICVSSGSISALNNSIYFLSNQGVVMVSDTGVQIVSRAIENLILPIVTNAAAMALTHSYSSEADRSYYLSTFDPFGNRVTYVYNYMTQSWTTSDEPFFSGVSTPTGETYLLAPDQVTFRKQLRSFIPNDFAQNPSGAILWSGVMATGTNVPGERKASVAFSAPHGLQAGNTVVCSAYLSSCTNRIAAASLSITVNITVESVTSSTVVVFNITNLQSAAPVGANDVVLVLRSSNARAVVVGLNAAADAVIPLDAIADDSASSIAYNPALTVGSTVTATYAPDAATWYLQEVTTRDDVPVISLQGAIWRRIQASFKLSPIDQSSEDRLKQYSTAQVHFRNDKSCSRMKIAFANDFTNGTAATTWSASGFTGPTASRKYISGRQNILRTYVPIDAAVGTWIQPIMTHEVACEPWEVQIVSVQVESETEVTSR